MPTPVTTPKRQMAFSVLEDGSIYASFGPGLEPLILRLQDVPEHTQLAAITEGLTSRARAYCSSLEGAARTPAALRDRTAEAFRNLMAGIWKVESSGGVSTVTIEVEAAWRFRKMRAESKGLTSSETLAETAAAWAELDEEKQKTVKALTRYQQALAQVKAERSAAKAVKLAAMAGEENDSDF